MALTVRVLFDFDAQEGSSELCIRTGEIVTLTRQDVGEGWWEGVNSRGQQGLFPESYVEVINPSLSVSIGDDDDDGHGKTPSSARPRAAAGNQRPLPGLIQGYPTVVVGLAVIRQPLN
uniref:SH3 domain-containing protein n=1 Tax=Plectus sambesii TaxID=2011161 RepID=A0A914V188_9BILA